jgi:hypothetical protein
MAKVPEFVTSPDKDDDQGRHIKLLWLVLNALIGELGAYDRTLPGRVVAALRTVDVADPVLTDMLRQVIAIYSKAAGD